MSPLEYDKPRVMMIKQIRIRINIKNQNLNCTSHRSPLHLCVFITVQEDEAGVLE